MKVFYDKDCELNLIKDKRIGKIMLKIEKLEILKDCSSVGIQITKKRSHDKF